MIQWILQLQADTLILTLGIGGVLLLLAGAFLFTSHRKIWMSLGSLSFLLGYALYIVIQVGHPEVFARPSASLQPLSQERHTFIEGCWSAAVGCEQGDMSQCTLYGDNGCPAFPGGQKPSDFLEALLMEQEQWLKDCVTIAVRCDQGDSDACILYGTAHCSLFGTS
ncbi:hypothetical protein HYZ99_01340 [Candidatus Peregrinibacteria bacterium]|nr:hypothetical protein [Candidatus Peregrinibacteria bacterium]